MTIPYDYFKSGQDGRPLPHSKCHHCAANLEAATAVGPEARRPMPGDVSVCIRCGELNIFDAEMRLRAPMDDQKAEFMADPDVRRVVASAKKMILQRVLRN